MAVNGDPVTEKNIEITIRRQKPGSPFKIDVIRKKERMTFAITTTGSTAGMEVGASTSVIIDSEIGIASLFPASEYPQEWANCQYFIGQSYQRQTEGSITENVETAIRYYEAALSIDAFKSLFNWNLAQINLGLAYQERDRGNRKENIERAILAFNAVTIALPIHNNEWVTAQRFLGHAYMNRLMGQTRENYRLAMQAIEAALTAIKRSHNPALWAEMQTERGDLYLLPLSQPDAKNFENAIEAYKQALLYKPQLDKSGLLKWARVQEKLGNVYKTMKDGDAVENAAMAEKAYEQALTILTREAHPEDYTRL